MKNINSSITVFTTATLFHFSHYYQYNYLFALENKSINIDRLKMRDKVGYEHILEENFLHIAYVKINKANTFIS